jgi:cyclic pyranopterin phosphate synthase
VSLTTHAPAIARAPLVDTFGRHVTYLRVSLTDACNFKCTYCVPPDGYAPMGRPSYLDREHIVRLIRLSETVGIERVRLTGGEPLLRHDIVDIVRGIKEQTSLRDVSITTNGSRLKPLLQPLKDAGLDRINISLDSLDPARFKAVTRVNAYSQVLDASYAAIGMGFPVKLNMVVMKGLTADEVVRFVQMAYDHPIEVRFLEFMPLCGSGWVPELVFPISAIREIIRERFVLEEASDRGDQVAQTFKIAGGKGKVGLIASLTESFCGQCSRIRMTADGRIRPCLFSDVEVPLGALLREDAPDEAIIEALRESVRIKPAGNQFKDTPFTNQGPNASAQGDASASVVMQGLGG